MKPLHLLLIGALSMGCLTVSAQWQWVDKDGRKVFSDRAPPPDVAEKSILKRPSGAAAAPVPTTDTAPPPTEAAASNGAGAAAAATAPKDAGVDKALEAKKKQAAEAEAAKRKAEEERLVKAKIENCARAKQAKAALDSGVRISRTAANGEREFLDDAARATEMKAIQASMEANCK
jgi:type IV secretory pathway VirB10-like protein